jgi:hypothetical protein
LSPAPGARDWSKLSFVEFADRLAADGFAEPLSPVQRVAVKIAFDRLEPRDLDAEEYAIAQRLLCPEGQTEPIDVIPSGPARRVFTLVKGARIGGTYVFGALYSCWRTLTADLSTLAPGEKPRALLGAPDLDLAAQALNYAKGVFGHPELAPLVIVNSVTQLIIRRPDGWEVEIMPRAAAKGGRAFRSRSLVSAVLSEVAFFEDSSHAVNDVECFAAVSPRVLPGGLTVLESTPYAEMGLLHDEFSRNHGKPTTCLAMHGPTLFVLPTERNRDAVTAERIRDAENAEREFDAKFIGAAAVKFFDPRTINAAIDPELALPALPAPHTLRAVGVDLGFVRNSSVGCPVERGASGYRVLNLLELKPGKEPLKPSRVFAELAALADAVEAEDMVADGHYSESAREAFVDRERSLAFIAAPSGQQGKAEMYTEARRILAEGQLRLPNHPRLLNQLREVMRRPLPGGGMAIYSPEDAKGAHGDTVSALCAAVWRLSRLTLPEPAKAPAADPSLERFRSRVKEIRAGIPHESTRSDPTAPSRNRWTGRDWRRR